MLRVRSQEGKKKNKTPRQTQRCDEHRDAERAAASGIARSQQLRPVTGYASAGGRAVRLIQRCLFHCYRWWVDRAYKVHSAGGIITTHTHLAVRSTTNNTITFKLPEITK